MMIITGVSAGTDDPHMAFDVLFIDGEPKEVVKETCWKLQPDLLITRGAMRTPEAGASREKISDPCFPASLWERPGNIQPTT